MPYYEFYCPACDRAFTTKRTFSEAGNPLKCARCEEPAERIYHAPLLHSPDISAAEAMNEFYNGDVVLPGMTREGTMALARYHRQTSKAAESVIPKVTISTPSHPAATGISPPA